MPCLMLWWREMCCKRQLRVHESAGTDDPGRVVEGQAQSPTPKISLGVCCYVQWGSRVR
jgi:hypothetical protein